MAGTLGEVPLAAHSCIANLGFFYFPVPYSVGIATTIRVGNALGAADPQAANGFSKAGFAIIGRRALEKNRWIDRNVPSQSGLDNEHGGFLYFRHYGSAVIFLIDLDDAIPTPNLGAGSLIRHAFRLCKHQIKMN